MKEKLRLEQLEFILLQHESDNAFIQAHGRKHDMSDEREKPTDYMILVEFEKHLKSNDKPNAELLEILERASINQYSANFAALNAAMERKILSLYLGYAEFKLKMRGALSQCAGAAAAATPSTVAVTATTSGLVVRLGGSAAGTVSQSMSAEQKKTKTLAVLKQKPKPGFYKAYAEAAYEARTDKELIQHINIGYLSLAAMEDAEAAEIVFRSATLVSKLQHELLECVFSEHQFNKGFAKFLETNPQVQIFNRNKQFASASAAGNQPQPPGGAAALPTRSVHFG